MDGSSVSDDGRGAMSALRRRKRRKKPAPPPWGKVAGRGPRLAMIALIRSADANGIIEFAHDVIDDYAGGAANSKKDWLRHLVNVGAIELIAKLRVEFGMFGKDCYRIALENEAVAKLTGFFGADLGQPLEVAEDPLSVPDNEPRDNLQILRQTTSETGGVNSETDFGTSVPESSRSETAPGPYKEPRAGARASKSIIYHSLPNDYANDDQELRDQIAKVLSVCGVGTEGVNTQRLIDSLEFHIPRALDEGYDFDRDIVPCIQRYTRYERASPLNRFDLTFDQDLPKWRNARQRREAWIAGNSAKHDSGRSPQAEKGFREGGKSDQLDRALASSLGAANSEARRSKRVATLRTMIAKFDSEVESAILDLRLQLPPHQRDLTGRELLVALRPVCASWKFELMSLVGHEPH